MLLLATVETSSDGFDFQPVPARSHDANSPARDSITTLRPRAPQFAVHQHRPLWLQSIHHNSHPTRQTQLPARAFPVMQPRRKHHARDDETHTDKSKDEGGRMKDETKR